MSHAAPPPVGPSGAPVPGGAPGAPGAPAGPGAEHPQDLLAAPEQSFLRRNRLGLVLLVPALALALGTTAMHYATVYRPSAPTSAHAAGADGWSRMDVRLSPSGVDVHRVVAARITAQEDLGAVEEVSLPGTHIVRLEIEFEAPSDSPLVSCGWRILGTDGDLYTPFAVGQPGGGSEENAALEQRSCVPESTPGPGYGFGDETVVEDPFAEGPRPQTWTRAVLVSVPDGVDVSAVRIGWEPPDYLELPAPGA